MPKPFLPRSRAGWIALVIVAVLILLLALAIRFGVAAGPRFPECKGNGAATVVGIAVDPDAATG